MAGDFISCHRLMEQVWDYQDSYDLGLYTCPVCDM